MINNCEKCGFSYKKQTKTDPCSKCGDNTQIEKSDNTFYKYDEVCLNKKCKHRCRIAMPLNQYMEGFYCEIQTKNEDGTSKEAVGLCASCS